PRLDLADHADRLGRADRFAAAHWDEQHVHVADLVELLGRQLVPKVAQVAEDDVVHVDDVDGVLAKLGALLAVVVGAHAGDQNAADLVFACAVDREALIAHRPHRGDVRVIGVIVADRDDVRGGPADVEPDRAIVRVGQHDTVAPAQAKACMSEILYVGHLYFIFLAHSYTSYRGKQGSWSGLPLQTSPSCTS